MRPVDALVLNYLCVMWGVLNGEGIYKFYVQSKGKRCFLGVGNGRFSHATEIPPRNVCLSPFVRWLQKVYKRPWSLYIICISSVEPCI